MSFQMTLSDLLTRCVARSLCDSWASCNNLYVNCCCILF